MGKYHQEVKALRNLIGKEIKAEVYSGVNGTHLWCGKLIEIENDGRIIIAQEGGCISGPLLGYTHSIRRLSTGDDRIVYDSSTILDKIFLGKPVKLTEKELHGLQKKLYES